MNIKKGIIYSTFLIATCLLSEPEVVITRLAEGSDGKYYPITEEEYQKTERRDFTFKLLPTEEALKRVGDAFGKRIIIYHPFENSKYSAEVNTVSFEDMMHLILSLYDYEYKEFEGGIVVVTRSLTDKK